MLRNITINMTNTKRLERFYRKRKSARQIALRQARKNKSIVFGSTALNAMFPPFLDRHTEDVDVFTPVPRQRARQLEKTLDSRFKGDFFQTKKAIHSGTYRVRSKVTKRAVADFSKPKEKIPFVTINGQRFAKLSWIKAQRRKILRDPSAKFRHAKDREALKRIRVFESLPKRRRMPVSITVSGLTRRLRA